jgi:hypothetical protein
MASIRRSSTAETLDWPLGVYDGSCGKFVVDLAPSAPESPTWAMMLTGFGALRFVALRREAGVTA